MSSVKAVEVSPNITAELNDKGELRGIEILDASQFVWDSVYPMAAGKGWAKYEPGIMLTE